MAAQIDAGFDENIFQRWSRSELQKRLPNIVNFSTTASQNNIALICASLSRWYAENQTRLNNFVPAMLATSTSNNNLNTGNENLNTQFPFNENFENFVSSVQEGGRYFISQQVMRHFEYGTIFANAAIIMMAAAELYRVYFVVRDANNLTEASRHKINQVKIILKEITVHMVSIEFDWMNLKQQVSNGQYIRSRFKRFELKVKKLERKLDDAINEVVSLQFEIDGKIEPLQELRNAQIQQGISNTINFGISLVNLMANPTPAFASPLISFVRNASIYMQGNLALSSFHNAAVNHEVIRQLKIQLEDVKQIKSHLLKFREKIDQINEWIIDNCDDFEDAVSINSDQIQLFNVEPAA